MNRKMKMSSQPKDQTQQQHRSSLHFFGPWITKDFDFHSTPSQSVKVSFISITLFNDDDNKYPGNEDHAFNHLYTLIIFH